MLHYKDSPKIPILNRMSKTSHIATISIKTHFNTVNLFRGTFCRFTYLHIKITHHHHHQGLVPFESVPTPKFVIISSAVCWCILNMIFVILLLSYMLYPLISVLFNSCISNSCQIPVFAVIMCNPNSLFLWDVRLVNLKIPQSRLLIRIIKMGLLLHL